jgi:transcriptional regulator of arginine metabolism
MGEKRTYNQVDQLATYPVFYASIHRICSGPAYLLSVMQKQERQEIILNLVSARRVASQHELGKILRKNGFSVTQASISRDLDELGIVKSKGFYAVPQPNGNNVFGLQTVTPAGDAMLVVKCFSGLASAAAVKIDASRIEEIVGTIAGDDTIFVAVKDQRAQRAAMRKIWEIFEIESAGQGV